MPSLSLDASISCRESIVVWECEGSAFTSTARCYRFLASEWDLLVEGFGGDDAALDGLGVSRDDFFKVFSNDLSASPAIGRFALRMIEGSPERATSAAIRFTERNRPRSGLLRELCLRGLKYNGRTNWASYSTALTAGEVLGRNFAGDAVLEDQLLTTINSNPSDTGSIMALCEGWSTSGRFLALRSRFDPDSLGVAVHLRLATVLSEPERFVEAIHWASDNLQGDFGRVPLIGYLP